MLASYGDTYGDMSFGGTVIRASHTISRRLQRPSIPWGDALRDALIVFGWALALRLLFTAITADSYDPDEFVVLALSRDFAHGAIPYHSFMFFHPPGVLALFRVLQPIVSWWWPSARIVTVLIDSVTALLVWRIGMHLYDRRRALVAGLIYGASPIALLASVRVGQDSIITALGMAGLLLLLSRRSVVGTVLAGVCLGLAFWFKYPAILFVPVYVLAAPRRAIISVGVAALTALGALAPFMQDAHGLYSQTITWQLFHRAHADLAHRLMGVFSFWLLLNPLALPAALRFRFPRWVLAGFTMGGVFLLSSEVYYHYFVPIVPFAALLSAPLLVYTLQQAPRLATAGGMALVSMWAIAINLGPAQQGLGILQLSGLSAAVRIIDRATTHKQHVITDQFEYAYLARRPSATDYFWDMQNVVSAGSLERHLRTTGAVVGTGDIATAYPPGFIAYLDRRCYIRVRAGIVTIWLAPGSHEFIPAPGHRLAAAVAHQS